MRKWFRSFYSSGLFIPFILLLPYMCTIALNGADKALLLHSPGVEDMVPLMLMVQMKLLVKSYHQKQKYFQEN